MDISAMWNVNYCGSEPLLTVPKAGFYSKEGGSMYIVGLGECFLPCALSGE